MPKETMTPRERWLAVLNRQRSDRVPMDYLGHRAGSKLVLTYKDVRGGEQAFLNPEIVDHHPAQS